MLGRRAMFHSCLIPYTGNSETHRFAFSQCERGFFISPCLQPVPGGIMRCVLDAVEVLEDV